MVKVCNKCKKFQSPLELHRSLHSFPNKVQKASLYKKWVEFVGRKVCKSANLCSDHFDPIDYKNIEKRRLHDNAVPRENAIGMFQYIPHDTAKMQHDENNEIIDLESITPNPKRMSLDLTSPSGDTIHHDDNIFENTSEHDTKLSTVTPINTPNVCATGFTTKTVKKRIRKVGGMSRKQFTSNEDWEDYKTKHAKLLNQLKVANRNLARRRESKKKMTKLIAELKRQNIVKYEEFFKDKGEKIIIIIK